MKIARIVLCFGDSNTWGATPDDSGRFPWEKRWPGVLQRLLGDDWRVVEDGHCGRTTAFHDPLTPDRKGLDDLPIAIERAEPVDTLIIMLGTNDVKVLIGADAGAIALGMNKLIEVAKESKVVENIIIVAPPAIVDSTHGLRDIQFAGSQQKLFEVAKLYKKICQFQEVTFLNLTEVLSASPRDGIHLSEETHRQVATQIVACMVS